MNYLRLILNLFISRNSLKKFLRLVLKKKFEKLSREKQARGSPYVEYGSGKARDKWKEFHNSFEENDPFFED